MDDTVYLDKFKKVLKVSRRVKISKVATALRIDEGELFEKLVKWGNILSFKIDGDEIIAVSRVDDAHVLGRVQDASSLLSLTFEDAIEDLEKLYAGWEAEMASKIPTSGQDLSISSSHLGSNEIIGVKEQGLLLSSLSKTLEALKERGFDERAILSMDKHSRAVIWKASEYLADRDFIKNGGAAMWFHSGVAAMKIGWQEIATKFFKRVLELEPGSVVAWYNIGLALTAKNDLGGAMRAFHEALKIDPRDTDSWYNLAITRERAADTRGAMEAYKQALSLDPRHARSWNNLGILYKGELGDLARALHCFQQAASLGHAGAEKWSKRIKEMGVIPRDLSSA